MNIQHHIEELNHAIEKIKNEPVKGWIHKIAKSIKVRKIQRKIDSLKKELNQHTHK